MRVSHDTRSTKFEECIRGVQPCVVEYMDFLLACAVTQHDSIYSMPRRINCMASHGGEGYATISKAECISPVVRAGYRSR